MQNTFLSENFDGQNITNRYIVSTDYYLKFIEDNLFEVPIYYISYKGQKPIPVVFVSTVSSAIFDRYIDNQ